MFEEDLQLNIKSLLDSLEDFKQLEISDITDENLKKTLEGVKNEVINGIEKISSDIKTLSKQVEWKSFNIAFFGETNAGKSTLIEALIRGNGTSIGDGHKDFTKKMVKRLSKDMKNTIFLDMPGLEGKEKKLLDEICKAVNKSHVAFYVIGTNKEPEEGTMRKVKNILNNRAKVYSVINIRGKPSAYKYKKQLIDENIEKMECRIKEKFQNVFGNHYYDNISLNALIGFLAVGKPNREDLRKEQEKVQEVFGDLEKAYQFSNLYQVEKLIKDLNQNLQEEIKVSVSYKFLHSLESMLRIILKNKKKFDEIIINVNNLVEKRYQEVSDIILKYQKEGEKIVNNIVDEIKNETIKKLYDYIKNNLSKQHVQKELKNMQESLKNTVQDELKKLSEEMKKEIESKINELGEELDLYINLEKFTVEINLTEIIEKLKTTFELDILNIVDIILDILFYLANPILGIISFIFTIAEKILNHFTKGKQEVKKTAYKQVTQKVEKVKKEISKKFERQFMTIKTKANDPIKRLTKRIKYLKKISEKIQDIIKAIKIAQRDISTLLIQEIVDKNVKHAYIDLSLSSMLVVGINEIPKDKIPILRIKEESIKCFSSMSECFVYIDHKVEGEVIYVNDEFIYRALDIILSSDGNKKYKVRKIGKVEGKV